MIQKQSKKKKFFSILKFLGLGFCFLFFIFLLLFIYYIRDLPRPEIFAEKPITLSTRIYDRTGEVLLHQIYGDEIRIMISLNEVPDHLIYAILAAEDNRFYSHFGLDFKGIIRAGWANLRARRIVQGGSTLTQQLARTAFLTRETTLERKINEIILTLELERRYSKDQILEWYLNHVPFGIAHGVGMASQTFFNKPVSDLSLGESVILASLIRSPSRLSPFGPNKDELFIIKSAVLNEMVEENFITKEMAEKAKKEEIVFADKDRQHLKAPHFTLYVKEYLINKYGENFLRERGLRVITSLDWEIQKLAEQAIKERIDENRIRNAHNAALVAINPLNGNILALVGSVDWFRDPYPKNCQPGINCLFDPKFNTAINAKRLPGSAFKSFIYATAFERGHNDNTIINDSPACWRNWCPQNFDFLFRGPINIRSALAQSLNMPAVKTLELTGILNSIKTAQKMGITTFRNPAQYGLSLALGTVGVSPLDITSAYGVFATEGLRVPPISILRIEDAQGNIIEENKKTPKRVLSRQTSQLVNNILSDKEARSPMFGQMLDLNSNNINYNVAIKTGTTDGFIDGWAVGHTFGDTFNKIPLSVGVWAGNSDNSSTNAPGVVLAAPIWKSFMERVLF